MPSILAYNPLNKLVTQYDPSKNAPSLFACCRKAVIKSMTLKRLQQVQELPLPTIVKELLVTLSLHDFLIDIDKVPPESFESQSFPATCLITDSPVNLRLVSPSDVVDQTNPTFLTTFHEANQKFVVEEQTKTLDELIDEEKTFSKTLTVNFIWKVLNKLVQHLIDNDTPATAHLSTSSVKVLPNNDILIYVPPPGETQTAAMPQDTVYEAPEVINQQTPDTKALVWSIGCILYEILALEPAFYDPQGLNIFAVMMKVVNGQIPKIPATGSPELRSLLKMCLVVDPATRLTLQAMKDIIRQHI